VPKTQTAVAKATKPPPKDAKDPAAKPSLSEKAARLVAVPRHPCDLKAADLKPHPLNPRMYQDAAELKALADSIRSAGGVLQRLLVRPVPPRGGPEPRFENGAWVGAAFFQLVAGHRRWAAAKLAGLDTLPVDVALLSDEAVEAIFLVENDQRKDLTLSEQAAAYLRMSKTRTAEQMAELLGRPLTTVRSVLKVARLPADVLAAVDAGRLPRAVAELVARVPGEEARAAAAAHVLAGHSWVRKGEKPPKPTRESEPLTYRATKELIGTHFQVQLKGAPFSLKVVDLVPGAKDCESCPKRAGNDPDAAADGVRADMCLDPVCYRAKVDAQNARALSAAKETGKKLLSRTASAGLFQSWNNHLAYDAPYVDLDHPCHEDPKHRTFRTLLKGHLAADQVVVAVDHDGAPHELVDKAAARAAVKKHHAVGNGGAATSKEDAKYKQEQRDRDKKAKLGKAAAAEANRLVADAVVRQFQACPGHAPAVPLLQQLAAATAQIAWTPACFAVARRRGLAGDVKDAVTALAAELVNPGDLLGLVAELVAARLSGDWASPYGIGQMTGEEKAFWAAFGIDRKKLVADAEAGRLTVKLAKGTVPIVRGPDGKPDRGTVEGGLYEACHNTDGAAGRWETLRRGATDAMIKDRLGDEWGLGGGSSGPGLVPYQYKGGKGPAFWWNQRTQRVKPTLAGKALLDLVRAVLEIPQPAHAPPFDTLCPNGKAAPAARRVTAKKTAAEELMDLGLLPGPGEPGHVDPAISAPRPEVPVPSGPTKLSLVEGLADDVVTTLHKKNVRTLGDLKPLVERWRRQDPTADVRVALFGELMPLLGSTRAGGAAEAICNHLQPARLQRPTPLPPAPPAADLSAPGAWRALPLGDLDVEPLAFETLRAAGVATIGQLTDRFLAGDLVGLSPLDAESLQDQIELASSSDPEPVDFTAADGKGVAS
jgi:ParB/RepB/Spo0J family partition protein